jgi:hypothetical protein
MLTFTTPNLELDLGVTFLLFNNSPLDPSGVMENFSCFCFSISVQTLQAFHVILRFYRKDGAWATISK